MRDTMCYTRLRVSILYLFFLLCVAGCSRGEPEDNAQSYLERSEAYIAQGQYRAALIETSNAMASAPDNIAYRVAMADIYNILGAGRRASEFGGRRTLHQRSHLHHRRIRLRQRTTEK